MDQTSLTINITNPKKHPHFVSILLALLFCLILVAFSAFGIGYLIGKIRANDPTSENRSNQLTPVAPAGMETFFDAANGYSLFYPKGWQTAKKDEVVGVSIFNNEAKVEVWLTIDQPLALSQEQKEGLTATNKVELEIDKRKVQMTEYVYKNGEFFSVLKLAPLAEKPQATFWLRAKNQDDYKLSKEIAQTLKFL